MPLQRIQLRPGVVRDTTNFAAEGTWWDCNNVRFRAGLPEKIGGWVRAFPTPLEGVGYSIRAWATITPPRILTGIGTSRRFYIESNGQAFDITPAVRSATPVNPFATVAGSSIVVVTYPSHGVEVGMSVVISGVLVAVGGIPASAFNQSFIADPIDINTFRIDVGVNATSTVVAGGGAPLVSILAPSAADVVGLATGWGASPWSFGGWGDAFVGSASPSRQPQLWSQDNLGSNLFICPRGGRIYYWAFDNGGGLGRRAVSLQTFVASLPPQDPEPDPEWLPKACNIALFHAESEILVAVGVNPTPTDETIDPMFVRWSDESDPFDWEPRVTNRAGGQRLTSGSQLIAALRVRENILIWSDTTVYSMQFIGGGEQFSIEAQFEGVTIQGPNAAVVIGGAAYWMGDRAFYKYDGTLRPLACPITDRVFSDISRIRGFQVACGYNERFNEIWWYYCDANDLLPSKYIIYNFAEDVWTFGEMSRTAWSRHQFANRPYATLPALDVDVWGNVRYTSTVLIHETGPDDVASGTPAAIPAFIESTDFDISEGHVFSFVSKMIPDLRFDNSTAILPTVTITMKWRNEPGRLPSADPALNVEQIAANQYTPQLDFRLRARQSAIRIESNQIGCQWRWGVPRLDVRPDGRQ